MSESETGLSVDQIRAVNLLAGDGAESDGSDAADCESEAMAGWSEEDPEFIASLNRANRGPQSAPRAQLDAKLC
jgi:hypothetical protein